jgi:hypothetical protein
MKRAGSRASLILTSLLALAACNGPTPARSPEKEAPKGARFDRDVDPTDIFPADLDLVVRVDIGRMRAGIGPSAADELLRRAFADSAEPELRQALACAEVVWIAAHAADLEAGDRVIAVEGKSCMPDLLASRWERVRSANGRVRIFDRKTEAPRAGTARIMNLGNKATVFVSPVELDAVKRVIDDGPDERRGNPTAEGLVSLDLRARPLPPALAKKYAAIASVLAGVDRVRGSAVLGDDGVKIEAEVLAKTPASAEKAGKFLSALRESLLESAKFGEAAKQARVEPIDKVVRVKVVLPAKLILAAMAGEPKSK